MNKEELFENYKELLKNVLGEEPKIHFENGKLKIFKDANRNFVLFGSEFLSDLEEFAAPLLRISGKEYIDEIFKFYQDKIKDKEKTIKIIIATSSVMTGWGVAEEISRTENSAKMRVYDSFEANAYIKRNKKTDKPVCSFIGGVLQGLYENYFGKKVKVKETQCAATGAPYCEFEIKVKE